MDSSGKKTRLGRHHRRTKPGGVSNRTGTGLYGVYKTEKSNYIFKKKVLATFVFPPPPKRTYAALHARERATRRPDLDPIAVDEEFNNVFHCRRSMSWRDAILSRRCRLSSTRRVHGGKSARAAKVACAHTPWGSPIISRGPFGPAPPNSQVRAEYCRETTSTAKTPLPPAARTIRVRGLCRWGNSERIYEFIGLLL